MTFTFPFYDNGFTRLEMKTMLPRRRDDTTLLKNSIRLQSQLFLSDLPVTYFLFPGFQVSLAREIDIYEKTILLFRWHSLFLLFVKFLHDVSVSKIPSRRFFGGRYLRGTMPFRWRIWFRMRFVLLSV